MRLLTVFCADGVARSTRNSAVASPEGRRGALNSTKAFLYVQVELLGHLVSSESAEHVARMGEIHKVKLFLCLTN
jgi:hypothetical protein